MGLGRHILQELTSHRKKSIKHTTSEHMVENNMMLGSGRGEFQEKKQWSSLSKRERLNAAQEKRVCTDPRALI
jgi:hypothetical protein